MNRISEVNKDLKSDYVGNAQSLSFKSRSLPLASTSISDIVIQRLKHFTRLFGEESLEERLDVSPALWEDELGRLRVWAANIGAHQTGQSSLDYRLREASNIKDQTLRILQRLERAAQDLEGALQGSESEDDFLDDEGEDNETEIQSIYHAIRDTIDNLFQMSMLIRRPAQRDRLLGTKRSDAVAFEPFDRQHVESKYPNAEKVILDRLGLAISQRRAVMRYRERHHIKLGQGLDQAIGDHPDTVSTRLSETVATEILEVSGSHIEAESHSVVSETSYAQTILHGGEGITIPPPPKASADGTPFECPYCFVIISIENPTRWARHVFSDLMPYVCIIEDCPTPHRLYESRREWFSHFQTDHFIATSSSMNIDCALCMSSIPLGKQFERHVGRHLEELALFALPRSDDDENEDILPSDISDASSNETSPEKGEFDAFGMSSGNEKEGVQTWNLTIAEVNLKSLVGPSGATITDIGRCSGAHISVARAPDEGTGERSLTITGTREAYEVAKTLINEAVYEPLPAHIAGESQLPKMPVPVEIVSAPAVVRDLEDDEQSVLENFEQHATHCSQCLDALNASHDTLCERGHVYALDVKSYIYSKAGNHFAVVDRENGKLQRVKLPHEVKAALHLLEGIEAGLLLKSSGRGRGSASREAQKEKTPELENDEDENHGVLFASSNAKIEGSDMASAETPYMDRMIILKDVVASEGSYSAHGIGLSAPFPSEYPRTTTPDSVNYAYAPDYLYYGQGHTPSASPLAPPKPRAPGLGRRDPQAEEEDNFVDNMRDQGYAWRIIRERFREHFQKDASEARLQMRRNRRKKERQLQRGSGTSVSVDTRPPESSHEAD